MSIGPRDKPSPLILHINSTNNAPAKIAEASAIYVTTLSAVNISATNYLGLNLEGAGTPSGPDIGMIQYYASPTQFGADTTFKYDTATKTLYVSTVSSVNFSSVTSKIGVLDANTIINQGSLNTANLNAAYATISELSSSVVSATVYRNLPTSSLSGLADVSLILNPNTGQSLVWSSTRWIASSVDHGNLVGLQDNDHPQYVLSSTNSSLSSLVASIETSTTQLSSTLASHIASAVHWNLTTLNTNYLNSSGDNSNSEFYLGTVSATTLSATNYLNLPSSTIVWSEVYATVFVAKNGHTSTLPKGTPVAITGANGTNIIVTPLSSVNTHVPDAGAISNHVAGLTQVQMDINATGHVVTEGLITGFDGPASQLNTNAFNEGDILYVSSNGQLNNVRPPAPYESHPVGYVTRKSSTNGEIYVKIETQPEINDIVGFNLTRETIRNGDLITYDITTSTFVNSQNINISGSVSAGVVSATEYLNLPSGTAIWNASGLVGRKLSTVAAPQDGQALVWHAASQHWEPSSIQTGSIGAITNNPGGSEGDIQFKYQTGFSGVDSIHYDYDLNQLHVDFISGTDIYFTNYRGLPTSSLSGQADTQITSPTAGQVLAWNASKWVASALPLNNYVLTSTNNTLSSLVSNIQTSTVNLSSTVSNLQTSTLNLSSLLGSHIASAVHWTLTTLNSNYINASGDSANASFFLQNLSGTNISATNWIGLPSAVATWNASAANGITFSLTKGSNPLELLGLDAGGNTIVPFSPVAIAAALNSLLALSGVSDTNITTGNVGAGKALIWNGSKWQPSSISAGATSLSSLLDTSVTVTPSGGQALVYSSSVNKWYPGYTIYQENTAPDNSFGRDGDIYFQYTDTANVLALSSLTDTQITSTPSNGQSLVWSSTKWVPSSVAGGTGAAAFGANYRVQFYNNGQLSSIQGFEWNPNLFGGYLTVSSPVNGISVYGSIYSDYAGIGNTLTFYGPGGQDGVLDNGPAASVSATALLTPSLSATTVSATTYKNLPSGVATWNASALQGTTLNLTPTAFGIIGFNDPPTQINAFAPAVAAVALNPEFSLSSLKDTQGWVNPSIGYVLKWDGSKWTPGTVGAGTPGGSNYQLQFNNGGSLSAVQGLEYVPNLFGNPQLVLSGNVSRLYATNSIYTPYVTAATQLNVGPGDAIVTSETSSAVKVLSSILIPSAIFFGSGIPGTAQYPAGIYYTGKSVHDAPPAIYQCNQDNLNAYVNFTNNKAFRIVDQVAADGGFAGSGYEFDGNSFIIQHGVGSSATLTVPRNGVLNVVSAVSAVTVSATNIWNTIFKTSDQSVINTTVYTPDNDLRLYMDANKSYTYRTTLFFSSTANGDFKFSPSSAGTISRQVIHRRTISPGATAYGNIAASTTTTMNLVSATALQTILGPPGIVNLEGIITNGASPNTFYIMWSQNAADNTNNTTVMAGSYMDWKLLN